MQMVGMPPWSYRNRCRGWESDGLRKTNLLWKIYMCLSVRLLRKQSNYSVLAQRTESSPPIIWMTCPRAHIQSSPWLLSSKTWGMRVSLWQSANCSWSIWLAVRNRALLVLLGNKPKKASISIRVYWYLGK